MLQFLQNSWVISIAGGIISGVLVFFISKFFINRSSNKEYIVQIYSANSEVINILKPYIADNGLPNKEVFSAVIESIARKYNLKVDELYSMKMFCQELIREIIGNIYVSNDKKREYTQHLSEYINNLTSTETVQISDQSAELTRQSEFKQKLTVKFSFSLSIIMALLSFITVLYTITPETVAKFSSFLSDEYMFAFSLPIVITLLVSIIIQALSKITKV